MKLPPDDIDLESYCVIRPYEYAWRPPYDGKFHQVRAGRSRKVYPPSKRGQRIYMGTVLNPRDKLRPVDEIRGLVDKRPVADLKRQADDVLKQLLCRAHCGDAQALSQYVRITYAAVESLETFGCHHRDSLRVEAEKFADWPLNLNQHQTEWAKKELEKLGVGTKFPLSTRMSVRAKRGSVWTRSAWYALLACADNKRVVPALNEFVAEAKSERMKLAYSRQTEVEATYYHLANGDGVIIPDWQVKCAGLSEPITKTNVNDWWDVVKWCVLHHWQNPNGDYRGILAMIPDANVGNLSDKPHSDEYYKKDKEYRKRNQALARVKQAFEGLVGFRCST